MATNASGSESKSSFRLISYHDYARSLPKTFTFDDAETLLGYFTYYRSNKGRTSGSRVIFMSERYKTKILLHKPHPRKELLEYQVKQLIQQLEQEKLL